MESPKRYRPNVAAVIVSAKYPFQCQLFIASRSDIADAWQFPQGGIDAGETPQEALYRELEEEIGTGDVEIIAEYPQWLQYDFPQKIAQKMYPFDGQSQKYFLVRLKKDAKINLATKEPEFCDYKFVNLEEVFDFITYFKRPVYKQVLEYFKKEGYL
ncbi:MULTISPECIES: RNA pyrophosphohydrolase [Sulfurospirillum]|uniref:RNA pyrophosphohydrolase n=3 Tax=Sulfurospirillum TaxID=57665 RepID=A0A1D7TKI3_9BACT|nr:MULTISPECIES: RNA pyrophosphohydrolase [Sulfurospirillum]AHJ13215.1 RNA pyrophosphohydrolase [Sulfurospirillum multivorans DSM 12446]AOO65505.1 RNA pyrophosphohydrolase [Sulfurospirillum halorespirans DSM 13726]QEH06703.1 RNA pyrophosphohydrolase [Sulfurospirillum multivorans]